MNKMEIAVLLRNVLDSVEELKSILTAEYPNLGFVERDEFRPEFTGDGYCWLIDALPYGDPVISVADCRFPGSDREFEIDLSKADEGIVLDFMVWEGTGDNPGEPIWLGRLPLTDEFTVAGSNFIWDIRPTF